MPLTGLHVIGTSGIGGTERFLLQWLTHADRQAFVSDVCVLERPGPLASEYSKNARHVWHLAVRSSADLIRSVPNWRRVRRSSDPDLLVLYGARANVLGRMLGNGLPVVYAVRSVHLDEQGRLLVRWFDRLTRKRVDMAIANSRRALGELAAQGYDDHRLVYIPPAVTMDEMPPRELARATLGVDRQDVIVLCVASLKPVKNHELLLRASHAAARAGALHELWLAGDGPARQRLEHVARELDADHVRFLGTVPDLKARYSAADLCVLASHWEGTPTTLLEATAAGVPTIATAVGDVPLLFADDECGRVVPAGDEPRLTEALAGAIADPARRARWRTSALAKSRAWSVESSIRRYEESFRRVVEGS